MTFRKIIYFNHITTAYKGRKTYLPHLFYFFEDITGMMDTREPKIKFPKDRLESSIKCRLTRKNTREINGQFKF